MTNALAAAPQSKEQLAAALIGLIQEVIPRKTQEGLAIGPETELADLGITSMAKIALAYKMEEHLGLDIAQVGEGLADVRTVGDVVALVERVVAR
jgi:acyl carrier protein